MLSVVIFLPLATALVVLALPSAWVRPTALAGAAATCGLSVALLFGDGGGQDALMWGARAPWIPAIGASYHVAVTGLSLPLLVLATVLTLAALAYSTSRADESRLHPFLFLLMETGLLGLFSAQDLLLFYVFFEVGLVPMYFIIGLFGHERRRYAALKFFLYTRLAGLGILLGILGLYLAADLRTFSLPQLIAAQPLAEGGSLATFVFFALLLGFAIKLPSVPLHNWLPDAHVEAPAEGSAILAGVQLKMGGYGLFAVLLPTVPAQASAHAGLLVGLGLASLIYGALAALGQSDMKRLVAFTSVNHMGFVLLAAGAVGWSSEPAVHRLATIGATYQMVSHGLLTGGMFLLVGMLAEQGGSREMARYGDLARKLPVYAALVAWLSFGSFGIPGMSGFVGEIQILGAAVQLHLLVAIAAVLAIILTTGLYLRLVGGVLLGDAPPTMPELHEPTPVRLGAVFVLGALSLLLGIFPGPLVALISQGFGSLGIGL